MAEDQDDDDDEDVEYEIWLKQVNCFSNYKATPSYHHATSCCI